MDGHKSQSCIIITRATTSAVAAAAINDEPLAVVQRETRSKRRYDDTQVPIKSKRAKKMETQNAHQYPM